MKDFAKNYIENYEKSSKLMKVLFCLLWDIPTNLYRFAKSARNDNTLGMVIAVILAIFGGWILFMADIICLALKDKIYWLDDFVDNDCSESSSEYVHQQKALGDKDDENN